MTEEETIRGLLLLGWSERRIARETGHHRATIRKLAHAIRGGALASEIVAAPGLAAAQSAAVAAETAEECGGDTKPQAVPSAPSDSVCRSRCEPHREFITAELVKGRNAVAIYQDLVEHRGYVGAYNAVKRFVCSLSPTLPKISCRFETEPGQEAQVDYGEGAPTKDPLNGKYRVPRLFVMSLGCSRHAFRATLWKSSKEAWCKLHEEAFSYFGGVPEMMCLDNLREGVTDPDIYDPELNALYADLLEHYGIVALPCRPYAPDLKGKVESAVGYTQRTALAGRRFESIEEQNAF